VTVVRRPWLSSESCPFRVYRAGTGRHGQEAVALEGDVERVAGLLERALLEARHDARDVGAYAHLDPTVSLSGSVSQQHVLRSSPVAARSAL
jgi:hypothetical protein